MQTPWGPSQHQKTIAQGIVSVSTAGHGGFYLSAERYAAMPADLKACARYAGPQWFEEDCEWALVTLAFPECFEERDFYFAVQTAKSYYPQIVTAERIARADAWLAKNQDKWARGSEGTADGGKWFVNIYNLATGEKNGKTFDGIPLLPAVFTLEQFHAAKLYGQPEGPAQRELAMA